MLSQLGHGAHEASRQEFLRDVKALELVHGLNLLLALGACVIQSLVLLLDEVDLSFEFLLPLIFGGGQRKLRSSRAGRIDNTTID